jgi:Cu+-exporting ATPase
MKVSATTPFTVELAGHPYYFCSEGCLNHFTQALESGGEEHQGQNGPEADVSQVDHNNEYTCPMHPEVRQDGPGACPECGMALEPVNPAIPAAATKYTCPMHQEIVRDEPGECPICGMALEPIAVEIEEEENPELLDMTRRFRVSAVLTVPLAIIAMGDAIGLSFDWLALPRALGWIEFTLGTPVVLWGG